MEPSKSNNTETEEETIAFNRKRARRVSFADNEITSVHIFRPDDDHSSSSSEIPAETLDIFRQLVAESDDEEPDRRRNSTDGEGEAVDHRNSFLQPIGSPSPGGSSINADDDTDDDEFGGPVSMDFIKPGRLSDSGVSDDITMDSTAFSMHYRSLARSDSGDLKTPTRFEATVSTPGLSSATPGSFMELTDREKRVPQSPVVASASEDSDAMSIEGEQPKTYDYVRLSPGLVAILAQGSKDLDGVSPLGSKATHPPIAVAFGSSTKNTKEFVNDETLLACKQLNSAKANRATPPNMDEGDKLATHSPIANHMEVLPNMESLVNSPVHQITHDTTVASALESSIKNTKEFVNDATPFACNQLDSAKANRGTPPKMDEADKLDLAAKYELGFCEVPVNESNSKDRGQVTDSNNKSDQVTGNHPVHEFTPLSCSANKLAFMVSPDSFRRTGNITRPLNLKQSGMLGPEVHAANSATLLSIRKNISKLKNLPNTSTLKEKNDKLKRRFSKYSPGTSFFPERDFENKQVETLTAPLEEQPFSLTLENNMHQSLINTGDHVVDSLINTSKLSQNEETVATEKDEEKICLISAKVSYNDKNLAPMDIGASPTLKTHITRVEDSTVEKRKDEILTNTHAKPFSSPVKSFDHTLLPSVECQSNFHGELKQMEMQNESVNSGLEQAIEYDKLTVARKLDLSGVGNSKQPSSPFEDAQFSKFIKSALKGKPARSPPNRFPDLSSPIQEATTALPSLQEPPSDIQDLSPRINSDGHGVDLDNNHHLTFQVAQSPLKTGIEVSSGEKRNDVDLDNNCHPALQVSHSPFTKTGIEVSSEKKRKGVELLSDIRALSHRINSDGHGVDLDNNCHPTLQVAQSPLTKTGIEVSSGKKRKGVQLLSNGDDIEKTGRIDRSQEVHKSGDGDLQFVLEQTSMRSEREKFGDQKWNDFDHVLERFSTSTKQLLSPSFDKLNFRLMGTLEDILVRLQKVKKWDILSSEIHSQKKLTDPLDIPRHKRVVEMKLLLFNIAYEKAKLQLMNVKRERLLEKVQQLSSGLQETQMMKNSMPCSAKTRLVDIQADDSHINTKIFNSQGKCQSALKGKPARSPPNRFPDLSSPIQEATTALPSLQEPPSDIQDLSPRINSDGHGVDLDNNHHLTFQVAQSPLKTGIEVSSGEKRNDVDLDNNGHPTLQVAQSPPTKTSIEVSSGKKRKGVQLLSNGDDIEKTGRIDRSQEVHKSGDGDLQFVLEQTSMRSEREKFGDQKWNDFDHVLERFSTSTKQLLSPSFDKLNFRLMGTLEDILVRLQKVKKWDILSSEIHSQKLTDPLDIPRHKRVVEMKLLLFNIAYEKAKLQLMNVKRERLLEKVQQLSSGLQETQMMKNSMPCSAKTRLVDIQADDSHINTKIFNSQGKCQVSCKNVMETRQELENLDQKAKSLSEFFYSYCKMKGDQSYTNVVRSVRDYLEKRISYKLVFQNLKLWDVEDFERKDDYHMIILNYRGYIIQRFTVNAGLSSIIVSNSLNDVNIGKTYPNMDAFSAFVFALNPHTTSKCMGRISMAQETQITGSLLSNLLDVVEEVQLARVEIRNLVQAKFNSHSVNQLDLQLSFIDFCGGKKVQVILDMTCLKCGAYPAEVLPSQIYGLAANGEQKALPSSLVDEIRSAAESVSVGYSRIVRLCRCISQAVQGCTQGR
ncbi:uncharacterized protein LOC123905660 isoform X3 [Trifolium pratense]|uniref:uncharacterized protein LOC123905660 isoform X3 n=1 Tax=Trifolium pratense TaxID=57577 RepID=UPI001E6982E1|nr:uncharacterized protein LOC123905660 isoform X3 [Trifolium pratense]